jgi:hypothetical protein
MSVQLYAKKRYENKMEEVVDDLRKKSTAVDLAQGNRLGKKKL